MSEPITKTYLNAESSLKAGQRKYLAYPNPSLVPCELAQEKDRFTLTFDDNGLRPFSEVLSLSEADKCRALANVAALEALCAEYSFSLAPTNLMLDINLMPKVLERDIARGEQDFVEEYRALVGTILLPNYSFDDFMRGGRDLYSKRPILKKMRDFESASQIKDELTEKSYAIRDEQAERFTQIPRNRARIYRLLIPILSALSVLALAASIYVFAFVKPRSDAILAADQAYLRQDYVGVQDALRGVSLNDMPYETKYMLARSCVMTEALSSAQRENVLTSFTMHADERHFCYWIEIGRLNFDSAIDYAKQLSDDELELYAWAAKRVALQNDTNLSGADKQAAINEADSEIERLQKKIEDNLGLLNVPDPTQPVEETDDVAGNDIAGDTTEEESTDETTGE